MTLAAFNSAPAEQARAVMLGCCAAGRFADAMTAGRPYASAQAAGQAAEAAFTSLGWDDVREAEDPFGTALEFARSAFRHACAVCGWDPALAASAEGTPPPVV